MKLINHFLLLLIFGCGSSLPENDLVIDQKGETLKPYEDIYTGPDNETGDWTKSLEQNKIIPIIDEAALLNTNTSFKYSLYALTDNQEGAAKLYKINPNTGTAVETYTLDYIKNLDRYCGLAFDNTNKIFFATGYNQSIYVIDAASGKMIKKIDDFTQISKKISGLAYDHNILRAASPNDSSIFQIIFKDKANTKIDYENLKEAKISPLKLKLDSENKAVLYEAWTIASNDTAIFMVDLEQNPHLILKLNSDYSKPGYFGRYKKGIFLGLAATSGEVFAADYGKKRNSNRVYIFKNQYLSIDDDEYGGKNLEKIVELKDKTGEKIFGTCGLSIMPVQ